MFSTKGPYTIRAFTESILAIGKDGVAIHVILNRLTEVFRKPSDTDRTARLHNIMSELDSGMGRMKQNYNPSSADSNDQEGTEYATD